MALTRVIAITGCDSGLGWALAARSARVGLITVAGMYNGTETNAADALRKLSAHPRALDVTNKDSVNDFSNYVLQLIKDNPSYALYAVVNNAGVMTIGDYEWQTGSMIENTINVNLLGAMRVVSAFLPELRMNAITNKTLRPRIINVASHCGLQPLPGFAAYSASKAGLVAYTEALRFEQMAHGLSVLAFIPGGFIGTSNIVANHITHGKEMLKKFNDEQKTFYAKRLTSLMDYLGPAAQDAKFDSMRDENIIGTFMRALTEENPKELYKVETWRYKIYYTLLKLPLPYAIRYWLIKRFISFPTGE